MTLKFYYHPFSTAFVTAAVFAELEDGLKEPLAERVIISIANGETRTKEFLENVNPNGLIPALVHDGVPIWESSAITMYLGETFGVERGLYPAPGPERGRAMGWVVWANMHLAAIGGQLHALKGVENKVKTNIIINCLFFFTDFHSQETEKEAIKAEIAKRLAVLNGALEGKDYLLGNYGIVDTHVSSFVAWVTMHGVGLSEVPNVQAWHARIQERPVQKKQAETIK